MEQLHTTDLQVTLNLVDLQIQVMYLLSHMLYQGLVCRGEEELKRCRQSLRKNIEEGNGRDPNVAVKVCTKIGKIADSNPTRIRHTAVIDTLRDIVLVMYVYSQHPYSQGQVHAACNYALCKLLKVNNVIENTKLRGNAVSWIAYVTEWNIRRVGSLPDGFIVPVGHTAAAAARKFIWTKEDNVIAFLDQQPKGQVISHPLLILFYIFKTLNHMVIAYQKAFDQKCIRMWCREKYYTKMDIRTNPFSHFTC